MTSYPEPLVARTTGINRERVAAARKASLTKSTDWTLENSVVCYTAPGLKKLLVALGLGAAPLTWPSPGATPPANEAGDRLAAPPNGEPDPKKFAATVGDQLAAESAAVDARPLVDLRVAGIPRNPSILHARPVGGTSLVTVRVRSNANFTIGMSLRARAPAPGGSLYHFESQCPRWKGRY